MTGVVITSLPNASTLTGAEYVPVVQSGTTVKTPVNSWSYTPAGTGAVTTTVQSKLRETVSVKDFGAVGDGVTDDTAAIQAAFSAATSGVPIDGGGFTYIVQYNALPNITINGFTLRNITLKAKSGSGGTGTGLLVITGTYSNLFNVTVDGNQAGMSGGGGGCGIYLAANYPTWQNVIVKNCTLVGVNTTYATLSFGNFSDCHFDNNASLGWQFYGSSYLNFINCTFNYNGYGLNNTRPYPINTAPANQIGFGLSLRCRSHHITFTSCQANDCGRDGFATGQGSYAIKFIGCQVLRSGDGGFTMHNDNDGTGLPGEGESPYDVTYTDCEAANSYTSGIAAYCPVYGVQVIGGRYYNNNRVAGNLTSGASYLNGIYIAAGSQDAIVRGARCYDDRQLTTVTGAASGSVVPVTTWTTGTYQYYPNVAFYDASGVFKGYASLSAETSGSITIATAPYNGVAIASIASGWTVTQRVQHNGVFVDNASQGSVEATCSGHLPGVTVGSLNPYTGFDIVSGGYNSGQCISLPRGVAEATELLLNPSFDSNITNWTASGPSFTWTTTAGQIRSPGAASLDASTYTYAEATLATSALTYVLGGFVRFTCWAKTATKGTAGIVLIWNGGTLSTTVYHSGSGIWELLEITAFIPSDLTGAIFARLFVTGNSVPAYFDSASLRSIAQPRSPNDGGLTSRYLPY